MLSEHEDALIMLYPSNNLANYTSLFAFLIYIYIYIFMTKEPTTLQPYSLNYESKK